MSAVSLRLNAKYISIAIFIIISLHYLFSYSNEDYATKTSISNLKTTLNNFRGKTLASTNNGSLESLKDDWKLDEQSSKVNTTRRANACMVSLARNSDLWPLIDSMRQLEDRFNERYHYPWVFLNDEPFTEEFKKHTSAVASGPCTYGLIDKSEWGDHPSWIDEEKAKNAREQMEKDNVIYGGSLAYRHMCRYQSGFFWRHPLLEQYEYYWRVEPNVKYFCNLDYDPFLLMQDGGKKYGWTVSIYEYEATIKTLWDSTKEFIKENPQYLAKPNQMEWLSHDGGETYDRCHFWSNFEIASLDFWRGDAYRAYFDHLDKAGGFFYERWGDAPVHSIAAALFLKPEEMHFFQDIGYRHEPFQHCPKNQEHRCACDSQEGNGSNNFEFHSYGCTREWKKLYNWQGKDDGIHDNTY